MANNKALPKNTGEIGGWKYEITTTFVQVPDEKLEAYWAALEWFAQCIREEIQKEMEATHEET